MKEITNRRLTKIITITMLFVFSVTVLHPIWTFAKNDISIEKVRRNLIAQFEKVEDYMVRVKVTVDMPKFRMPSKTIDVAFKQPDKMKVESTGFAIAPKSGMHFSPKDIFEKIEDAQVTDSEYLDGEFHWVVTGQINPDSAQQAMGAPAKGMDKPVQMLLWIDPDRWVISKTETRSGEQVLMEMVASYQQFSDGIWLPERTEVQFTFPEGFMGSMPDPDEMADEFSAEHQKGGEQLGAAPEPIRGSVIMEFMNYKVNSGIKDSFFNNAEY